MVSAFERPSSIEVPGEGGGGFPFKEPEQQPQQSIISTKYGAETETEDEEVKRNCLGGFSGIQDSDMSSSSSEDDDDDESDEEQDLSDVEEEPRLDMPVLTFGTRQVRQTNTIQCPRATRASPHDDMSLSDGGEEEDPASSEEDNDMSDAEDRQEEEESDLEDESGTETDDEASESESDDDEDDDSDVEEDEHEPAKPSVRIIIDKVEKVNDDRQQRKSLIDVEKELQARHTDLESLIGDDDVEEGDDLQEDTEDDFNSSAVLDRSIPFNMPLVGGEACLSSPEVEQRQAPVHKRCLSPESEARDQDADDSSESSPKRIRCNDGTSTPPLILPELTLGPSAFYASAPSAPSVSPSCCSSEAAEDRRLSEELMEATSDVDWVSQCGGSNNDVSNPVPLLTPPGSPLRVELSQGGETTTVCEWPSNLTVDNAIHLMPPLALTSAALDFEDNNHDDDSSSSDSSSSPHNVVWSCHKKKSGLTPLIRGLAV